jgi:hypothetical protein
MNAHENAVARLSELRAVARKLGVQHEIRDAERKIVRQGLEGDESWLGLGTWRDHRIWTGKEIGRLCRKGRRFWAAVQEFCGHELKHEAFLLLTEEESRDAMLWRRRMERGDKSRQIRRARELLATVRS